MRYEGKSENVEIGHTLVQLQARRRYDGTTFPRPHTFHYIVIVPGAETRLIGTGTEKRNSG